MHCAAANCWDGRHCLFKTVGTLEFAVKLAFLSRIVLFRYEGTVVWAITVHLCVERERERERERESGLPKHRV